MSVRLRLLASSLLALPMAAHAQLGNEPVPLGYPVSGLYIGAEGGFNVGGNENFKNLSSNSLLTELRSGVSTPNLNVSRSTGAAASGKVGYGFGNGLRVEVEGLYRGNSFKNASNGNRIGVGGNNASGSEQGYGPM